MKTYDSINFYEVGDRVMVPYFGNIEDLYNTMVEVEVVWAAEFDTPAIAKEWRTRFNDYMIKVRLFEENDDENGNKKNYMDSLIRSRYAKPITN